MTKYCITIILGLFAMLTTASENLNTWQKQMPITFSGYTPPGGGTLTNFPALVIFSNTTAGVGFAYSNFLSPPYADLRFAAGDKSTPLNFEVEKWDTNGNSYMWVQVPALVDTNTQIWAFWGRDSVVAPACTTNGAAWDVNYVGVWHLANGSVLSALDSTSNRNNGVISGSTAANGLVDGAANFAGSQSIASSVNKAFSDFTAETWFKDSGAIAEYERLLDKKYDTGFWVGRKASLANTWGGGVRESSDPYGVFVTLTDGVWHQMVSLRRGSTHYIYGDGGSVSAFNTVSAAPLDTTQVLFGNGTTGQSFGGMLDEVRISNIARSSNWIWTCYMNTASNWTFNTYGPPAFGGAPRILNSNTVVTIPCTTLNGFLVSTGMDANVSAAVFWGTNDAGQACGGWANTNCFPVPAVIGPLSTNVVPTVPGSKHYYRFYATNSLGDTWADPAGNFTWLGAPSVNNAGGATNVFSSSATLQGEVTGGNPTPNAWIYWGTMDKGVNKTLWEHETPVGVVSNWTFSANVSLSPGLTYYYRCYASNTYGEAWASTTTNFTATIHSKTWNDAGANALASNPANWVGAVAPVVGDDVILNATTIRPMTWDLNIPLSTWTQVGYLGTVTVATVYGGVGFANLNIMGNCIISNGMWTHFANTAAEANRLNVSIGGNLIIGPNAVISATSAGYAPGQGPGYSGSYLAGSHGGLGAYAVSDSIGLCYGSITAPTNLGSGGSTATYGKGGGAIRLTVAGTITHNGIIVANAFPVVAAESNVYSGSGGSIWLTAGALKGNGSIQANANTYPGDARCGGGGGRIALVVTNASEDFSSYTGGLQAYGGAGSGNGAAGTVYLQCASDPDGGGRIVVDNGGVTSTRQTEINPRMPDVTVASVCIQNKAHLAVAANHFLVVSGVWSNGGSFTARAGCRVIFSDNFTPTSRIYGASTFFGLVCTNAGVTLVFQTNTINSVAAGGQLDMRGSATASNVFLRSSIPGQSWKLNVSALASQSVWNVDVQDSDAGTGAAILAMLSKDSARNVNWVFNYNPPGGTNVWTGVVGALWSTSSNWSFGRIPFDSDSIKIPASPNNPVVDGLSRTVAGLEIGPGATLSLNGRDFTITGSAVVSGALVCAAGETVTFQKEAILPGTLTGGGTGHFIFQGNAYLSGAVTASGTEIFLFETNVDLTGCTFASASSTVILAGVAPQRFDPANQVFHKVEVANSVVFANGFFAYEFLCETGVAQSRTLVFPQGQTISANLLALLGTPGTANITLRSSIDGQPWLLNISGHHTVRGVDARDSNASAGQMIYASGSRNAGNNANWNFTANWAEWTGQAGNGQFGDPANWAPAVVPGENSWVRIDIGQPMTTVAYVKLGRLIVGGGNAVALVMVNGKLTVVENVEVRNNGILEWNQPGVAGKDVQVLPGGLLTHTANSTTEAYKLNLVIRGNLVVSTNGAVDVTGKGHRGNNIGPGAGAGNSSASHGGRGTSIDAGYLYVSPGKCYGSILTPTNLGSSGRDANCYGGGAVRLLVHGTVTNNGIICAKSPDVPNNGYTGTGGSIWLTAGALVGSGAIRANAGYGRCGGGGGRIALIVTNVGADFSLFTGVIQAYGGQGYERHGAAGTVYRKRWADHSGRGTVLVDNYGLTSSGYTDVPPSPPNVTNEVEFVAFNVTNAAMLRLTNDYLLGDIWLDSANARLDLGSKTLTVRSREHSLSPGGVLNYGQIIWWPYVPHGTIFRAK